MELKDIQSRIETLERELKSAKKEIKVQEMAKSQESFPVKVVETQETVYKTMCGNCGELFSAGVGIFSTMGVDYKFCPWCGAGVKK